jgi:flagellar motor switch protein FliN/FliY
MPADPALIAAKTIDIWGDALASVIESMTSSRPAVSFQPLPDASPPSGNCRWWGQKLSLLPEPSLWIGAAAGTWDELAKLTLAALGVDDPGEDDIQATCRDILAQATSALAQRLAAQIQGEVTGADVISASDPGTNPSFPFTFSLDAGNAKAEGVALVDRELAERLSELASKPRQTAAGSKPTRHSAAEPAESKCRPASQSMGAAAKLNLRVRVVLGRASLPLGDLFKLNVGSAIELDRSVNDLADVMVGDHRIARGQVVVVNGNYGIKVAAAK